MYITVQDIYHIRLVVHYRPPTPSGGLGVGGSD